MITLKAKIIGSIIALLLAGTVTASVMVKPVGEPTTDIVPQAPTMPLEASESAKPILTPSPTPKSVIKALPKTAINPDLVNCYVGEYGWFQRTKAACEAVQRDYAELLRLRGQTFTPKWEYVPVPDGQLDIPSFEPPQLDPINPVVPTPHDYDGYVEDFNDSVNTTPKPTPCVPVGDGFNCL